MYSSDGSGADADSLAFLPQGSEAATRLRECAWSRTALGEPDGWPEALRRAVALILSVNQPMLVFWGEDHTCFYNDAFRASLGAQKDSLAPGLGGSKACGAVWEGLGAHVEQMLRDEAAPERPARRDGTVSITCRRGGDDSYWSYSLSPIRTDEPHGGVGGVLVVCMETTSKVEGEQRATFHLRLEERLRELISPRTIMAAASETLGRHLGAQCVGYSEPDAAGEWVTIESDWSADGFASVAGTHRLPDFGSGLVRKLKDGATVRVDDVRTDDLGFGEPERAAYDAIDTRAFIAAPLVKGGRLVAILFVLSARPRAWTPGEVALVEEVGERTWSAVERARAVSALTDREARLRFALEVSELGDWDLDIASDKAVRSRRHDQIFGYQEPVEEWGFERFIGHVLEEDREEVSRKFRTALEQRRAWEFGCRIRRTDGELRWIEARGGPVHDDSGKVVRLLGVVADVTERKRSEVALAESEARFHAIANSIDQMVWSTRPDGYHDYYNRRWYEFTGVPEGSTDGDDSWNGLFHPEDQERAWTVWRHSLKTGEPYHIEYRLRHRSGQYRWVLGRAQPVRDEDGRIARWYGTCTDIQDIVEAREVMARSREELEGLVRERTDELMALEEQLRQAQKMEAIGQLTGGVAHDFNNMLAVISGSLDLLSRRIDTGDARARRYVDAAKEGAQRAANLTQRLLAFSRQQPLKPKRVDANKLVSGMSELLKRSLGGDVRLETVLAAGLWTTYADPNQLESVILNLAVNARDAMAEGGRLTIETQNSHLDTNYASANVGVPSGQYVMIAVTDTGAGMAPEVIAKAFDPFFTTKEVGKGTGLGLSQVYGYVKQSGGHVKIYSEPGEGTTVKIYLPRWVGDEAEEAAEDATAAVPLGDGNELVLVVEDEPAVRRFSVDALGELGYRVLEADSAAAALRLIDAYPEIALLFTDVVMPEVNGRRLADEARRRRPDLKVLFTTGYTRNAVVHNGVLDADVELISKPFTIEELASRVRAVLDAPAARADA